MLQQVEESCPGELEHLAETFQCPCSSGVVDVLDSQRGFSF
jgi:hypothetical protein